MGLQDISGVPIEIFKMDEGSIQLSQEALKDGNKTVHSIHIMVVVSIGTGKSTLIKRLIGGEVNMSERLTTEAIEVHCCDVSLSTGAWKRQTKGIKDWKYGLAIQQTISVVEFLKQSDKMSPKKAIQPDIQLINLPVDYGSLNKADEKNEFLTVKSGHIFVPESSCMNTSLDENEFLSRNRTLNKENVVSEYDKLHTSKNNNECPTTNRTSVDDKRSVSKRTKNGTIFRTKFHISRQMHNNRNSPSMEIGIRRCSTGPVNQTLSRYSRKKRSFEYKSAADRLKNCNFPGDAVEMVR